MVREALKHAAAGFIVGAAASMFFVVFYEQVALLLIGTGLVLAIFGVVSYAAYAVQVLTETWSVEPPATPYREG